MIKDLPLDYVKNIDIQPDRDELEVSLLGGGERLYDMADVVEFDGTQYIVIQVDKYKRVVYMRAVDQFRKDMLR